MTRLPACKGCGACCRYFRHIAVERYDAGVPMQFTEPDTSGGYRMMRFRRGACAAWNRRTGLCRIYGQRPRVCRQFPRGDPLCKAAVECCPPRRRTA